MPDLVASCTRFLRKHRTTPAADHLGRSGEETTSWLPRETPVNSGGVRPTASSNTSCRWASRWVEVTAYFESDRCLSNFISWLRGDLTVWTFSCLGDLFRTQVQEIPWRCPSSTDPPSHTVLCAPHFRHPYPCPCLSALQALKVQEEAWAAGPFLLPQMFWLPGTPVSCT